MADNTGYVIIAIFILLAVFLAAVILFFVAQQKLLQLIEPEHRQMRPGQVWLQLIPLYGWVWQFTVVARIADSIQAQLLAQDSDTIIGSTASPSARPTYKTGISYCILTIVSTCIGFIPAFDILDSVLTVLMVIAWIIYWIELEKYKRALKLRLTNSIAA